MVKNEDFSKIGQFLNGLPLLTWMVGICLFCQFLNYGSMVAAFAAAFYLHEFFAVSGGEQTPPISVAKASQYSKATVFTFLDGEALSKYSLIRPESLPRAGTSH